MLLQNNNKKTGLLRDVEDEIYPVKGPWQILPYNFLFRHSLRGN
jgi:hypothetical protein